MMEVHPSKRGIWTQHVDESTGRTYYFNLVHQRSYWTLPEELQTTIQKPLVDTLREWDPDMVEKQQQELTIKDVEEEEMRKKKREEVLLAAAAEGTSTTNHGGVDVPNVLDTRMALAAQKKKAEEMQRMTPQSHTTEMQSDNEYLKMVRALESKDRDTETSGGKWLVR